MATVVQIRARANTATGRTAASGFLLWEPTSRYVLGGELVLPSPFKVLVSPDTPSVDVTVDPTSVQWVWKVTEHFVGAPTVTRYLAVPETGPVAYTALVEINPVTLAPTATPEPAWWAAIEGFGSTVGYVTVADGNEDRPDSPLVLWIGGTVKPANMGGVDLWFQETDSTGPTVPTGLAVADTTQTAVSLTWTPSTDNSGVASYTVRYSKDAGAVLSVTSTTPSATITGLTAGTTYSVSVTATDTVGNTSAASESLAVTTAAPLGTPRHSVFEYDAFPYSVAKYTDSTPLTVANAFYSYGTSPDMSAWRVRGAKIWVPAGVTLTQPAQVSAWLGANADIALTPVQTAQISDWVAGVWNEVIFPEPIETNTGQAVYLGYRFANGDYLAATGLSSNFVTAKDGSHIVFADDGPDLTRARYRYDGGATATGMNGPSYSIDAIWDEGPA